jgi:hypothetical protein
MEAIQMSTDEHINKMWYVCTMGYCSASKMKEILIHSTTQMNLENSMLSEISQSQKQKYSMILLK